MSSGPVGFICGSGRLPIEAADAAIAAGRAVFLIGLRGAADPEIERFPHTWVRLGEVGKLFKALDGAGAREITLLGGVQRPSIRDLGLDMTGLVAMPELKRLLSGGDDKLLRGLVTFVESRGYRVIGVHEAAPDLLAPEGIFGAHEADAESAAGVSAAMNVLAALGPFDVGQAAVALGARVVAIEAAEGTDGMLRRVARMVEKRRLRRDGRGGVLVKLPKPGQDLRIDLPAIGPRTIELAIQAGLSAVAVAAGGVLIAEKAKVVAMAVEGRLFVAGVPQSAYAAS
ncbi:LpxI family protein [Methylopila musalis]|uniref:LpxI family protein n=1 Tax=Methylopila musalis TaxID=1134781 RepID=A0ABW3Z9L0_9HYPH